MPIHESAENYLETILMLSKRLDVVRSIDIAADMRFSKPSVSIAMKNLRQEGFIVVQSGGSIVLTQSGLKIAERIYERHCVIARFLMQLGVEEPVAFEDACKIEHDISTQSFQALKDFLARAEKKPSAAGTAG
jgi:Mn-dependent DtxR family transcriptional regulator